MKNTLLSPLIVGNIEIKNRMSTAPMVTCFCDDDGMPTEQFIAYLEARAKGGFGLIITEDYAVDPRGRGFHTAGLWKDEQIEPHSKLTERVHAAGAKIFAQIYHCGRQTLESIIGAQPVSASALPCPVMGETPRELTVDEIKTIVGQFGDTALRAKKAGFDGVEIHGAHGYLIAQFLSSYANKRTDEYGGNLTNRMRFPLEAIADIKAKCGDDFVVSFRISADEFVTGGRGLAETLVVCQRLEAAGIALLHVTVGTYETSWAMIPPMYTSYAWIAHFAAEVKKVVSIPVQTVGRIKDPAVADTIVKTGQADLVSFGRASLADPELPNKYIEGRPEQIRHCIGCNQGCTGVLFVNDPIRCLVNPSTGFEGAQEIKQAETAKKVLVIGGGPAGLEAARGARLAGHDVTVYERRNQLGGSFKIGAYPPGKGELASYPAWLGEELGRMGVPIALNTDVTADLVAEQNPDVVVYAAGSKHARPPIPGIDASNVVEASDVLTGAALTGKRVVIAGGGSVGAETGWYLASIGRQVTIVDQLPELAMDEEASRRRFLTLELDRHKVRQVLGATITQITQGEVTIAADDTQVVLPCDTVVLALGMESNTDVLDSIKAVADVRVVGDAEQVSDARRASREGFVCGLTI